MATIWYKRTADGNEESLEIDVVISETFTGTADPTEHPVESGANKADHVCARPPMVRIEGLISNAPVSFPPPVGGQTEDRVGRARDVLESIRRAGAPVNLELGTLDRKADAGGGRYSGAGLGRTTWQFYEDYALTSLTLPRDKSTGDSLRFSATFTAIETVESQTVDAPVITKTASAKPRQDAGNQNVKAASEPDAAAGKRKLQSALHAMFGD